MERCRLSDARLVDLPGETVDLPAYALPAEDPAIGAGVIGVCWQSALIASGWGAHWADRLAAHYAQTGLIARPRAGAWRAFRNPNLPEILLVRDDGRTLSVRLDQPRRTTSDGLRIALRPREYNLHLEESDRRLAEEVQAALRRDGAYAVGRLIARLGLEDRILASAALSGLELRFEPELEAYWTPTAVSAMLTGEASAPIDVAPLVASEPAQEPPQWI